MFSFSDNKSAIAHLNGCIIAKFSNRTLGFMKICSYHFKWQMWDGSVSTHTCLLFVATETFQAWKGIAPNVFATVLIAMAPANFRSQTLVWFLDETT